MARPTKKTVDYFPHFTNHGKTLFVLESKWGNDGYAFWFKLLEIIGNKDGMMIDCDDVVEWEFLQAKTRLSGDKINEILSTLANLEAINKNFWSCRIVYSDNFVNNISDAFKRRSEHLPSHDRVIAYINQAKPEFMCAFVGKEKGKEKGKGKVNNKGAKKVVPDSLPEWMPIEAWNGYVEMRKAIKKPMTDNAKKLAISKLQGFHEKGFDIKGILEKSTFHNWQGLYGHDDDGGRHGSGNKGNTGQHSGSRQRTKRFSGEESDDISSGKFT